MNFVDIILGNNLFSIMWVIMFAIIGIAIILTVAQIILVKGRERKAFRQLQEEKRKCEQE